MLTPRAVLRGRAPHGSVSLYHRLGLLRCTGPLVEARRLAKDRPDIAQRVAGGERIAMATAAGLMEFGA